MREELEVKSEDSSDLQGILDQGYRGSRYSFGYPACPELADQRKLFEVLNPEEIGVSLTEGDMMDPEASVSALVFHHPQASYFSVGIDSESSDITERITA